MPRIDQAAMEAALAYFQRHTFQTKIASMWEAFLTGKVIAAKGTTAPSISDTDEVVGKLFVIDPASIDGRLRLFRYGWADSAATGRKTVWNQTTRGNRNLSASLFVDSDIRNGLVNDPESIIVAESPRLPSKEALTAVLVREHNFSLGATWSDAHSVAEAMLGMSSQDYGRVTDGTISLGVPLSGSASTPWSVGSLPSDLLPTPTVVVQAPTKLPSSQGTTSHTELVIEERTERMIRRAVAKYPFILLIGPPGTGKGTLISWITEQVQNDPESFGFELGFDPDPMWRTPDESWSSFDLIGGLAPDEAGVLSWSQGALLHAIESDRWLVLDETNRADMDKIMGPLLTWLSRQSVEIGRDSAHGGAPIIIDWEPDGGSKVEDGVFAAGMSWRLFGTYNPADAQKVFKFGLALSRRFVVIPIPTLDAEKFETLLFQKFPGIDPDVSDAVTGLYRAHFTDPFTQLGPAIFLRIVEYLEGDNDGASDSELLSEAYIMNMGKYVAAYDDTTLENLGRRVTDEGAITEDEWAWIKSHRDTLG